MSENQKPVSAGGVFWVITAVVIFAGILWIAEKKTDKMVSNFAGISVRNKSPSNWPEYIERQMAGLSAQITGIEHSKPPRDRGTKAEEREQWEKDKDHLHHHVANLEIQLKEKTEQLEVVRNSTDPEAYSQNDSDLLAEFSQGEVEK